MSNRAGDSEGPQSHTRSFSSVSRLRAAASASRASEESGGGVGLLRVERRGEVIEARLTADRAVAPLVMELECMDGLRRGGGLWSADDILWVTLGTLYARRGVCLSCSSRARVRYIHHDGLGADSIRIPRSSKISFIASLPLTHPTCSY
jgi:hypothetical protein